MAHLIAKAILGAAIAATAVVSAVPAYADPSTPPAANDIVGVGSDTTQDVLTALSTAYNATNPADKLYSWDATGTTPITTKTKAGCTPITRPDGSSLGITALKNDTKGCIDFARSSRAKKTDGSEAALAFFAFGQDGVTWASQSKTNAPKSLTKVQLHDIYACAVNARTWKQLGGKSTNKIKPYLPQVGSGTRKFFLDAIGLSDIQVGTCVTDKGIQENDGKALPASKNAIEPYSIAKWIAQKVKKHNDRHGKTVLHQINKKNPTVGTGANTKLNVAFTSQFLRIVFNVTKKVQNDNVDPKLFALFGANGIVCSNPEIIESYGFLQLGGGCGLQS